MMFLSYHLPLLTPITTRADLLPRSSVSSICTSCVLLTTLSNVKHNNSTYHDASEFTDRETGKTAEDGVKVSKDTPVELIQDFNASAAKDVVSIWD